MLNSIKKAILTLLASSFSLTSVFCQLTSDPAAYVQLVNEIRDLIPENGQDRTDFVGAAIRLAWHDASSYRSATNDGGVDGCINFEDPDNNGLEDIHATLTDLHTSYTTLLTQADIFQLAAQVATVESFADNGAAADILDTFLVGRPDNIADGCSNDARQPSPHSDFAAIEALMGAGGIGFSTREIVVLMGAHSVGRAQTQNSGFDGEWDNSPNVLDNQFYDDLVNDPWNPNLNDDEHLQYDFRGRIMLHTDMALAFEVEDYSTTGLPADTSTVCGNFPNGRGGGGGRGRRLQRGVRGGNNGGNRGGNNGGNGGGNNGGGNNGGNGGGNNGGGNNGGNGGQCAASAQASIVQEFINDGPGWQAEFAAAMVNLSYKGPFAVDDLTSACGDLGDCVSG